MSNHSAKIWRSLAANNIDTYLHNAKIWRSLTANNIDYVKQQQQQLHTDINPTSGVRTVAAARTYIPLKLLLLLLLAPSKNMAVSSHK